MGVISGLVLFAVIWFMVLFVVLPLRLTTQEETGDVVPGTPSSAPVDPGLRGKVRIVTAVSVVLWAICAAVILTGAITVADLDFFGRLEPVLN